MIRPGLLALVVASLALPIAVVARVHRDGTEGLRAASSFASIRDPDTRSVALFTEMGKVIQSPRCMNCHPRTDRPSQFDTMLPHQPAVLRGPGGKGVAGMECSTCHGPANVDFVNGTGSIPGNPNWHLAPIEMAWQGKSLAEICRQIKDPSRNGGKSLDDLIIHNGQDKLVGWGWHPGKGRKPAPGTQVEFGALTKAWIDTGARCPA